MLELKGLYKTFNPGTVNEKRAIDGLDLTLDNGDFVTIIGGNHAQPDRGRLPSGRGSDPSERLQPDQFA